MDPPCQAMCRFLCASVVSCLTSPSQYLTHYLIFSCSFVSFLSQVEFHIWTTGQKNDMNDYFLDPHKDGT